MAITESGDVWINKRSVDIRAVRANIERLHAENPRAGVVIQADKRAQTGVLVEVMDASRLAGVDSVAIAADKLK